MKMPYLLTGIPGAVLGVLLGWYGVGYLDEHTAFGPWIDEVGARAVAMQKCEDDYDSGQ